MMCMNIRVLALDRSRTRTDSQFVDLIGIGHYQMVPGIPAPCMHRDVSVFASRNIQGIIQSVFALGIPFGE